MVHGILILNPIPKGTPVLSGSTNRPNINYLLKPSNMESRFLFELLT